MSSSFDGLSDAEIAAKAEQNLNDLARTTDQTSGSTLADESGVDDGAVRDFPATEGMPQVSVGRTGQTGGGTKSQLIPPGEGGEGNVGLQSDMYDASEGKGDLRSGVASTNPGGVNLAGDDITDRATRRHEVIQSDDFQGQQLADQSENPYSTTS